MILAFGNILIAHFLLRSFGIGIKLAIFSNCLRLRGCILYAGFHLICRYPFDISLMFFPMLLVHFPNRMDFCYALSWATADLELRRSVGEMRNPLRLPVQLENFLIYFYDKKLAYIIYKVLMKSKAENAVQTRVVLLWLESNWQLWCYFWENDNIADIQTYETNMSKIKGTQLGPIGRLWKLER